MSSTIGWTFLYLSIWPEKQERVQAEIDRVVGGRLPSLEDRPRYPALFLLIVVPFLIRTDESLGSHVGYLM